MKNAKWWLCGLLAAVILLSPALVLAEEAEGEKPAKPKKEKAEKKPKAEKGEKAEKPAKEKKAPELRGQYAMMVSELNLNDEQKAKLTEAVKAKTEALAEWKKTNGQKMKELGAQMKEATEKDKKAELKKQMDELGAQQKALAEKHDAAIRNVLTEEQKARWAGFMTYQQAMRLFRKVELTDEQKAKVKEICTKHADAYQKAADRKAKAEAMNQIKTEVSETVLTAEQKEAISKPKEKAPKADGGEGEKKEKANKAPKAHGKNLPDAAPEDPQ